MSTSYESSLNQLLSPQSTNTLKGGSQGSLKKWLFPDLRQEPARDERRTPCARRAQTPSKATGLCLRGPGRNSHWPEMARSGQYNMDMMTAMDDNALHVFFKKPKTRVHDGPITNLKTRRMIEIHVEQNLRDANPKCDFSAK